MARDTGVFSSATTDNSSRTYAALCHRRKSPKYTVYVLNQQNRQGASIWCIPARNLHNSSQTAIKLTTKYMRCVRMYTFPCVSLFFVPSENFSGHFRKTDALMHPINKFTFIIKCFMWVHSWVHGGCIGCILGASRRSDFENAPSIIYNTINQLWQRGFKGCIGAFRFCAQRVVAAAEPTVSHLLSLSEGAICDKKNRFYIILIILNIITVSIRFISLHQSDAERLLNPLFVVFLKDSEKAVGTIGNITTQNYKKCGYRLFRLLSINHLRCKRFQNSVVRFVMIMKQIIRTTPPTKKISLKSYLINLVARIGKRFTEKLSLICSYNIDSIPGGARGGFYA